MTIFDPTNMLSFDLETTTNIPEKAHIVTSALLTIQGSKLEETEMLANPGVPIDPGASEVHGYTDQYVKEHGEDHETVLRRTIDAIYDAWDQGRTLIVYNAPFDLTVLRSRSKDFVVTGLVYDPYLIDRAKEPYRKGRRNLETLCQAYNITLDNAHNATADALAAARIAWKQHRMWPELSEMSAEELMEQQAVWYYEAQTSLREYFERHGRDASTVYTDWPLRECAES